MTKKSECLTAGCSMPWDQRRKKPGFPNENNLSCRKFMPKSVSSACDALIVDVILTYWKLRAAMDHMYIAMCSLLDRILHFRFYMVNVTHCIGVNPGCDFCNRKYRGQSILSPKLDKCHQNQEKCIDFHITFQNFPQTGEGAHSPDPLVFCAFIVTLPLHRLPPKMPVPAMLKSFCWYTVIAQLSTYRVYFLHFLLSDLIVINICVRFAM